MQQSNKRPEYEVINLMTGQKEFSGELELCTEFMLSYGLGWSFLYIKDLPINQDAGSVKFITH